MYAFFVILTVIIQGPFVLVVVYSSCLCDVGQVAGDAEVKAQIRLQFHDITGQKCMAIRSLVATQKVVFYFIMQLICYTCHCIVRACTVFFKLYS